MHWTLAKYISNWEWMATASFAGLIIVTVIVSAESLQQVWMGGSSCVSRWWIHCSEWLLRALPCFSISLILVISEHLDNTEVLGCDENRPTPKSQGCGNRPIQLSCKMRWLGEVYLTANTRAHLQLRKSQLLGLPHQAEDVPWKCLYRAENRGRRNGLI